MQLAWISILLVASFQHAPTSQGSIAGRVICSGGSLPEMIVFLEPTDAQQTISLTPSQNLVVSQSAAKFRPSMLVVAVGQSVEFRNDEAKPIEHNVFSRSAAKPFDLGLYPPGTAGKIVTFDKPGVVRLYCSIHRYMDGVIYICPTPLFAKVQNGLFEINDVPAGQWRVRTWQRSARFAEQNASVRVNAGKTAQLELEMKR